MRSPAVLFRALADDTRLQMLALIARHEELCVCELEAVLGITQSKASRHLRYLLHAGWVRDRREAVWIHYRIADDLSPAHKTVLESIPRLLGAKEVDRLESRLADFHRGKGCSANQRRAATLKRKQIRARHGH